MRVFIHAGNPEPICSRGLRPLLASIPSLGDRRRCVKAAAVTERLAAAWGGIKTPALILAGSAAAIDTREREMANLVAQGSASVTTRRSAISRLDSSSAFRDDKPTTMYRTASPSYLRHWKSLTTRSPCNASRSTAPGISGAPQPYRRPYPDRELHLVMDNCYAAHKNSKYALHAVFAPHRAPPCRTNAQISRERTRTPMCHPVFGWRWSQGDRDQLVPAESPRPTKTLFVEQPRDTSGFITGAPLITVCNEIEKRRAISA